MIARRWLQLALAISLACNLVVVGAVIGRHWQKPPPLDWATAPLGAEQRARVAPILRQRMAEAVPLRRQMVAVRRELQALLAEPELDLPKLQSLLAKMRELGGEYQLTMHETAIVLMAEMAPDERRQVASQLLGPPGSRRPPQVPRQRGE